MMLNHKIKYKKYLEEFEKINNYKIGHSVVAQKLQANLYTDKDVKQIANALANRYAKDGFLSVEELEVLNEALATDIGNLKLNSEEYAEVDYYPEVFGSCGTGVFVPSQIKEKMFVPKNSFMSFSAVKQYSVINAIGESMLPFIQDKDKLIVEHFENEQIKDNKIYVFCYNDEIFVKRLIKNVKELIIKSDNPDPMYRPIIIEKEEMNEVKIIGQIVGIVREVR